MHAVGARTVEIKYFGSSNKMLTVSVSVESNGNKLPLFLIFKEQSEGYFERCLKDSLPENV